LDEPKRPCPRFPAQGLLILRLAKTFFPGGLASHFYDKAGSFFCSDRQHNPNLKEKGKT
jgi:hypothetical protein